VRALSLVAALALACAGAARAGDALAGADPAGLLSRCIGERPAWDDLNGCREIVTDRCMAARPISLMTDCEAAEAAAWDAIMARLFRDLADRIGGNPATARTVSGRLAVAQARWQAWRDAECDYQAVSNGVPDLEDRIGTGCRTSLAQERVRDLRLELQ
jgi:uncharacterized protein YecT (DUF1311 family)